MLFRRFWQDPWLFQAGEALQGLRHLLAAADGGRDHVDHGEGRVEVATRLQLLDRHAGRGQGLGVGDAFVAQWIELGRHADRRSVRMTLPPLPVAGLPKPIAVKVNLDAGVTEQMIDRLTVLRMQMLPKPSPVRKQN